MLYYLVFGLESMGRSRFLVRLNLYLNRFRIIRLLRDGWRLLDGNASGKEPAEGTLMKRIVKDRLIPFESPLYQSGLEQFKQNLRPILQQAREAGVPVLIGELVSNLSDQLPLDGVDMADSTAAEIAFRAAKIAESQAQYAEAVEGFSKANDLDGIRFRAPSKINEIIRILAREYDATVVPIETAFESASPNRLVGNNLLADHLHPNIDGCFFIAKIFYEAMQERDLISSVWDSTAHTSAWYRKNWPISALDTMIAGLVIRNLKSDWPFKSAENRKPFLIQFEPGNMIEELAMLVLKEKVTVGDAHLMLARKYEADGDFNSANREYDVITHLVFIQAYHYLWRAETFMRRGHKKEALAMLDSSLALENIPQARQLYDRLK
jgi:tetratricopeptide (TPR) repeat protein